MNYILTLTAIAGLGYAFYHLWRVFRPRKRKVNLVIVAEGLDEMQDALKRAVSRLEGFGDSTGRLGDDLFLDHRGKNDWESLAGDWKELRLPAYGRLVQLPLNDALEPSLRDQLQKAIETENYEEAARLRDLINKQDAE